MSTTLGADWTAAIAAVVAALAAIAAVIISLAAIKSQERLAKQAMREQAESSIREIKESRRQARDEQLRIGQGALYPELVDLTRRQPAPPEAHEKLTALAGRISVFADGRVQRAVMALEAALVRARAGTSEPDELLDAWAHLRAALLVSRMEEDLNAEMPLESSGSG